MATRRFIQARATQARSSVMSESQQLFITSQGALDAGLTFPWSVNVCVGSMPFMTGPASSSPRIRLRRSSSLRSSSTLDLTETGEERCPHKLNEVFKTSLAYGIQTKRPGMPSFDTALACPFSVRRYRVHEARTFFVSAGKLCDESRRFQFAQSLTTRLEVQT